MTHKIPGLFAACATAAFVFGSGPVFGQAHPGTVARPVPAAAVSGTHAAVAAEHRDGTHDFDFNVGRWHTHIRSLQHPLTGSTRWVELEGTVDERKIYDGEMLEHIQASGPSGHFEGLTLFLYHPQSHQWSQAFADRDTGTLEPPAIGEFSNRRGEFISQQPYQGRIILVRNLWSDIKPDSHRFEQAYSDDHGKTWEPNFVATLTRIGR
ncbi:hypothetical protein ACPPVV_13310 [Rhodanobacter sp. Col0626]|uniref:hypothetical protein n=1 Tax=Rhodanobacter sp. Col0626 TaxID=3415679 RepID=UPI003CF78121